MTQPEKWTVLLELYDYRRSHKIIPSAVPQSQLRDAGISAADVTDWQQQKLVRVLRTISDNIVKPLRR